jgi:hypothetical protein
VYGINRYRSPFDYPYRPPLKAKMDRRRLIILCLLGMSINNSLAQEKSYSSIQFGWGAGYNYATGPQFFPDVPQETNSSQFLLTVRKIEQAGSKIMY